jgi:mRNA interferase MazF
MVVKEGDIFWVDFSPAKGSEPKGKRPALVIQSNVFNESNINTIIVLAITSNLKYEFLPGNVRLLKNEFGMPKACVINVSQIRSIDRDFLFEKIGSLSKEKLTLVKEGLKLVLNL